MNASVSRLSRAALVAIIATASSLLAEDLVVQKDQQRREGEILGIAGGKLRIKIGPAETSLPLEQVASVVKAPPKAYDDALNAWQDGNANKSRQPSEADCRYVPRPPHRLGRAFECAAR